MARPTSSVAIADVGFGLRQALREIRSPITTPGQRVAWARVAEHALEHLPETEERLAETLSTARKVIDSRRSLAADLRQDLRTACVERPVSRQRIHPAPFAIGSDGSVLANLHHYAGHTEFDELLRRAIEDGHQIFIGTRLTATEAREFFRRIQDPCHENRLRRTARPIRERER